LKTRIIISLLLVVVFVVSGCTPKATTDTGPIKVAVLAPLSGQNPTFGASTRDGALLAIEEWNAKGGVLGRKLEAVVADSQCEADPGRNAANKVIDQDKVHYIVGEVCSKSSIPISEIAEAKGVVQISPTSTNTQVTLNADGSTKKFVFRACFIDPFQGLVMSNFALGKGYKTAFVMFDQGNDYVRGLAEAFIDAFTKAGGTIVGQETYTSQDTDFSAILTKVAEAKADVLYLPDYYPVVNLVGAQAKEKGVTSVMMGGDGWDSADLNAAAADGGYFSNHYSAEDTRPIVQSWVKNYQAKYGAVPDALATLAYDATNILIASIAAAGADDAAKVKDAMAAIKYEAVSGTVTFDAQHNPIKSAAVLHVTGGKVVYDSSVAP
jgi:branched-chain amino acid transport system substrate-binding protein